MLLTDWQVLATAGLTVDGREIKENWLVECAESYDPDHYEAVIDNEHELEWYGNFGSVHEVRLGKNKEGKTTLEGRLRPNIRMIEQYQRGQRLHVSASINTNWLRTGKAYLDGLALTDEPASVGTSRIELFSKNKLSSKNKDKVMAAPCALSAHIEALEPQQSTEQEAPTEAEKTLLSALKKFFTKPEPAPKTDENTMTPEQQAHIEKQFSTLADAVTKVAEAVEAQGQQFATKVEELQQKFSAAQDPAPKTEPEAKPETEIEKLQKQVAELSEEFSAALKTPVGATNIPENDGTDAAQPRGI